jgi:hypothetical protein
MPMNIPSLTVVAFLSSTLVGAAAPARQQAQTGAESAQTATVAAGGQSAAAAAAPTDAIPSVGPFYTLPLGDVAGPRVSFQQKADLLTAVWMTAQGDTYGRGTYLWDPEIKAFTGNSSTVYQCLSAEGDVASSFQYQVREQLYVVNAHELRDRWTKPLDVDCAVGLVEKFRWYERQWVASDKNWKPLGSSDHLR